MTVALIILFCALIALVVFLARRNNQVYRQQITVLSRISDKAKADIEAGRDWEWRYAQFNQTSYDQMLWKFWKPVGSFHKGASYLEDAHV